MSHNTAYSGQRDPINCPANQPKPTGEWTPSYLDSFWRDCDCETALSRACKAINAALAAEREKVARWMIQRNFSTGHGDTLDDVLKELDWQIEELHEEIKSLKEANSKFEVVILEGEDAVNSALREEAQQLRQQLAAERERLEAKWKASMVDVTTALQNYEKQLAAERENYDRRLMEMEQAWSAANTEIQQLRQQLAAEREKYQRSQEKVKEYFDLLAAEREKRKQSDLEWTTTVADMSSLHDDDRLYAAQTIQQLRDQPKPTGECIITSASSRMCEHGTKSCEVQHEPTGEWTGESLCKRIFEDGYGFVAKDINAALAKAYQEFDEEVHREQDRTNDLEKQLAAEREKYDAMVYAACVDNRTIDQLREALAAERKRTHAIEVCDAINADLVNQLSAEQALSRGRMQQIERHQQELIELRDQLAAEREKVQPLVDALKSVLNDLEGVECVSLVTVKQFNAANLISKARVTIDAALAQARSYPLPKEGK